MAESERKSRKLFIQAGDDFHKRRYSSCLQTLSQLEQFMGSNGKIQHNKELLAFYISECKDYPRLLKFLDRDIQQAERESDDIKNRVIGISYYNKAVLLYHLRQPFAALEVLTPLAKKIDDLDESFKSETGLLMICLLLATNQYRKAEAFLESLPKHLHNILETPSIEDGASTSTATDINCFKRMVRLMFTLTKILNGKIIVIPDDGSVEYVFLKAHQYYLGKDFQMAAKQFSKQFSTEKFTVATHGDDQDVCLANNMGVIHLRVRHYAIAAKFFQHAIQFDNKITNNIKKLPLFYIGASKKPEILYNLGIAMLHLQRPKEAFECFLVPLKVYQNNPRLWLRVAEACIMLHEKNTKDKGNGRIVSSVIGSGIHRKYVIQPNEKLYCPEDGQSFAIPNPNLEFAALCLRNAISIAEHYKKRFIIKSAEDLTKVVTKEDWTSIDEKLCNPSPPITKESFERLLSGIYTAYSYVCIRLGEFTIALEYAKILLNMENLSDANAMLGHLYCAESLIMLNRIEEAKGYLDPKFITNLNTHDFETKDWQINSIEAAQSVLRYNHAITLVLQGEFDLAKIILSKCTHPVVLTKHKMLKMYIELAAGNIDNCKIMIRIDTPQYR